MEQSNNTVIDLVLCDAVIHNEMPMPAWRQGPATPGIIEKALCANASFYLVEDGLLTDVFQGDERRFVWTTEFLPHLGPSVPCKVSLDDYPDGRCYSASEWLDERGCWFIVFGRFGT
jgi:hypothetical protein